jgi:hypothetical protein
MNVRFQMALFRGEVMLVVSDGIVNTGSAIVMGASRGVPATARKSYRLKNQHAAGMVKE